MFNKELDILEYNYALLRASKEEGILLGREEGIKRQIDTARNLLAMGLSSEDIARATGLALEQVLELSKEMRGEVI